MTTAKNIKLELSTPAKVAEVGHQERHREVFNQRAFQIDKDGNLLPGKERKSSTRSTLLSVEQYSTIIGALDTQKKADDDKLSPRELKEFVLFKKNNKAVYRWIKDYRLEYSQAATGNKRKVLKRWEPKRAKGPRPSQSAPDTRVVLPDSKIFDAIQECHVDQGSHLGIERTYKFCSEKYYNVTVDAVKIYCETCRVCNEKQPAIPPHKGAKRPIFSQSFRDRVQVDLVDMRKKAMRNIYGVTQNWILTVKDHFTGLTYVTSIPRKRPKYVAFELERIFGLMGYPAIFHTDNGKEFTGKALIALLREINPRILTVTGRPRTPRDQGSVESMNKLIEKVLQSIEAQIRLDGYEPNWTHLLGRVMATINTQSSRQTNSVCAYTTVFGMDYDQKISCSMKDARQCYTIEERLAVSKDERLAKVANEVCELRVQGESNDMETDELQDCNDDGYWSANSNPLDSDGEEESVDVRDKHLENNYVQAQLSKAAAQTTSTGPSKNLVAEHVAKLREADGTLTEDELLTMAKTNAEEELLAMAKMTPKLTETCDSAVKAAMNTVDFNACTAAANLALGAVFPSTSDAEEEMLQMAKMQSLGITGQKLEDHGLGDTPSKVPSSSPRRSVDLSLAMPWGFNITRGGKNIRANNTCAGDTNIMGLSLIQKHYDGLYPYFSVDRKLNQVVNMIQQGKFDLARYEWITYSQARFGCQFTVLPGSGNVDEYWNCWGTLEDQMVAAKLFYFVICDNFDDCSNGIFDCSNESKYQDVNQHAVRKQHSHYLSVYADEMHNMQNHFNVAHNSYSNAEPCGYGMKGDDRKTNECKGTRLVQNVSLEQPGLLQIVAKVRTNQRNVPMIEISTLTSIDMIEHKLIINGESYNLVQVNLCNGSHFRGITLIDGDYLMYDGLGVDDIPNSPLLQWVFSSFKFPQGYYVASLWYVPSYLLDTQVVETSAIISTDSRPDSKQISTASRPEAGDPKVSCDNDRTSSSTVATSNSTTSIGNSTPSGCCSNSAESVRNDSIIKTRVFRKKQGMKMMEAHARQVRESGVGPGAVVTVQVDNRDVSHPRGIIGVVYQIKDVTGGVLVVTEHGILTNGTSKDTDFWIPSDRYQLKYKPNEMSNITTALEKVKTSILKNQSFDCSTFDRISIQKAHQLIIGASSPCKKSGCKCKNGKCTRQCGCIRGKNPRSCSSSCSCSGSCLANPLNDCNN